MEYTRKLFRIGNDERTLVEGHVILDDEADSGEVLVPLSHEAVDCLSCPLLGMSDESERERLVDKEEQEAIFKRMAGCNFIAPVLVEAMKHYYVKKEGVPEILAEAYRAVCESYPGCEYLETQKPLHVASESSGQEKRVDNLVLGRFLLAFS